MGQIRAENLTLGYNRKKVIENIFQGYNLAAPLNVPDNIRQG